MDPVASERNQLIRILVFSKTEGNISRLPDFDVFFSFRYP